MSGEKRRKLRLALAAVVLLVIGYLGALVIANRNLQPMTVVEMPMTMSSLASTLPATITVTDWNLGYAGLGAESDFIADGGNSIFPPSGDIVQKNLDGIVATLGKLEQHVVFLQEVSQRSPLSWWKPVFDTVRTALPDRQIVYRPDVATWGIPWPLAIDHGTIIAIGANPSSVETVALPAEPTLMMGFLRRRYALQVVRIPIDGMQSEWVFANLHLSAFDDGGETRRKQLEAVLAFGQSEYEKGNHVILGGDWNMVLSDPGRTSTTDPKFLFWIIPFPMAALPAGWSIVNDPQSPTVRTLYKPYVAGENYVTAIDGFIVSPNVAGGPAQVFDTRFAFSDHMPVTASFTAN